MISNLKGMNIIEGMPSIKIFNGEVELGIIFLDDFGFTVETTDGEIIGNSCSSFVMNMNSIVTENRQQSKAVLNGLLLLALTSSSITFEGLSFECDTENGAAIDAFLEMCIEWLKK